MDPTPLVNAGANMPIAADTVVSLPLVLGTIALAILGLYLHWRRERITEETLRPLPPRPGIDRPRTAA